MSSETVRRSARRTTRQVSPYNVGDVIEVTRNDTVVKGKLLQQLSEGKTANPRWLVAFVDEPSWKDEELYEAVFGKHWPKDTEILPKPPRSKVKPTAKDSLKKTSKNGVAKSSSSSDAEVSQTSSTKKKSVAFLETSRTVSEGDSSPRKNPHGRSSAREQRSKRRHAQVEKEVVTHPPPPPRVLPLHSVKSIPDSKKARKDDEVVKVPMLTGTLYLYRGPVRRAEFIRHV